MRLFLKIFGALAAGLLSLNPAAASAQRILHVPPEQWTHQPTGAVFPQSLDGLQRIRITEFSSDGQNVGVSYLLKHDGKKLLVTVYTYPTIAGVSCEMEFANVRSHIDARNGAALISEGRIPPHGGRPEETALLARYAIAPRGPDYPTMITDAYLYCPKDSGWQVKYRATWNGAADAFPDVGKLMTAITSPALPSGD